MATESVTESSSSYPSGRLVECPQCGSKLPDIPVSLCPYCASPLETAADKRRLESVNASRRHEPGRRPLPQQPSPAVWATKPRVARRRRRGQSPNNPSERAPIGKRRDQAHERSPPWCAYQLPKGTPRHVPERQSPNLSIENAHVVASGAILHASPRYFGRSKSIYDIYLRPLRAPSGPFLNASVDGGRRIPMIPPPDRAPGAPRAPHGAPRGPGKQRSPASTERSTSNPEVAASVLGWGYGQPQRG